MLDVLKIKLSGGSKVLDDPSFLRLYLHDLSDPPRILQRVVSANLPSFVIQPAHEDDLAVLFEFCLKNNLAVVPRGAATHPYGSALPLKKRSCIVDLSNLRKVESVDEDSLTVSVKSGTRWSDIEKNIKDLGMTLRTYPTSWFSTVGGWIQTGGFGVGSIRYGHIADQIVSIKVVLPDGAIKIIKPADRDFLYFISTEGQFGVIWDVTLRLQRRPTKFYVALLRFESVSDAIDGVKIARSYDPYFLKLINPYKMHEYNKLAGTNLFEEKYSLLATFDNHDLYQQFISKIDAQKSPAYQALYLWNERLFPMRIKLLGSRILAAEVILSLEKLPIYAEITAKSIKESFGVDIALESYILEHGQCLVIASYTFNDRNQLDELFKASISPLLTKIGIELGGRPYGIGIWNTPFVRYKFGSFFRHLKRYKGKIDPAGLFNPGKFFTVSSTVLNPIIFNTSLSLLRFLITKIVSLKESQAVRHFTDIIHEAKTLCSRCASCIPVCPAYMYTVDERTTARGKLILAEEILKGSYRSGEARRLLLCMHCHACTDVCQSRLDLVPVWEKLEGLIVKKYGGDEEAVKAFVSSVEESRFMEEIPYGGYSHYQRSSSIRG